ncbi:hypothetical protein RJ55_05209 [Drechmeria coniospora]|nr:hypothetical protein RJ55_05209 [Drechmeria coniospora]
MPQSGHKGTSERKRRSRKGCWPCKSRKVNCLKTGDTCDYKIRLNWVGRRTKQPHSDPSSMDGIGQLNRQHQGLEPLLNTTALSVGSPQVQWSGSRHRGEANSPVTGFVNRTSPVAQDELAFVDETLSPPGSWAGRGLEDTHDSYSIRPPHQAAQSVSPAIYLRRKKAKSLSKLNHLYARESISSPDPFMPMSMAASPVVFDSLLTPATSPYSDDVPPPPHWPDSRPRGSPDVVYKAPSNNDIVESHDWYDGANSVPEMIGAHDDGRHGQLRNQDFTYHGMASPASMSWELGPLPDRNSRVNMLYFQHFIEHTARVLVPYHDAKSNPMSTTLPRMALQSDGLLSLLLAYSAAHQARTAQSEVPEVRMAQWAQAIFPELREFLADAEQPVPNVALVMSIMLASLEVISPGALGHGISWREHLNLAGNLMTRHLNELDGQGPDEQLGEDCLFIRSWLARIHLRAAFRPAPTDEAASRILALDIGALVPDKDEIDCIMGHSARCARLLSQVADMAKRCDRERTGLGKEARCRWMPHRETVERAVALERELIASLNQSSRPCIHVRMGNIQMRDLAELAAANEAFHWAGLAHLHRRVMGKDSAHADVQWAVHRILECLDQTRIGGSAEMGMLFPMFTAGCETVGKAPRARVLARFKSAERSGMFQVSIGLVHAHGGDANSTMQVCQARRLMETVWEEGCPWEALTKDEYIG